MEKYAMTSQHRGRREARFFEGLEVHIFVPGHLFSLLDLLDLPN